jgi:hypothetical protein
MSPEICPNCGADVPPRATACPECGACEKTGWSENAGTGEPGIPDDSFNYDEFVKREFGAKRMLPHGVGWFWWAVAIVVVAALLFLLFR